MPTDMNALQHQIDARREAQARMPNGMSAEDLQNLGDEGIAVRPPRRGILGRVRSVLRRPRETS
jgi:hypothetical protein